MTNRSFNRWTMTAHVRSVSIDTHDGKTKIATLMLPTASPTTAVLERARRIVASVNLCATMSLDDLERQAASALASREAEERERARCGNYVVRGEQSTCTRPKGHAGACRCSAADVDSSDDARANAGGKAVTP